MLILSFCSCYQPDVPIFPLGPRFQNPCSRPSYYDWLWWGNCRKCILWVLCLYPQSTYPFHSLLKTWEPKTTFDFLSLYLKVHFSIKCSEVHFFFQKRVCVYRWHCCWYLLFHPVEIFSIHLCNLEACTYVYIFVYTWVQT